MSFLLGTLLHSVQESSIKLLGQLRGVLYKFAVFFFTSTAILWLSVFMYVCFYFTYIPSVSHVKPVHFQFETCSYEAGPCSYPIANVSLMRKGYEQFLVRGQRYKVYLDLEMPESLTNRELGMFMVRIEFRSRSGEIVQSSSRATMLHFKSTLFHTISTIFFSPLLLAGSFEEKQVLSLELFDYFEDDPLRPSITASLIIQNRKIEFYSATLRIFAHFSGIRYLMFHWPVSSAVVGIGTNLFFFTIIALLSWYRYMSTRKNTHVVVRVGFEGKNDFEERRKQAKETLIREQKRQSVARESSERSRSRSNSPFTAERRTQSLERLSSKVRFPKEPVETLGHVPRAVEKSDLEQETDEDFKKDL